jgi:hypothetical protein
MPEFQMNGKNKPEFKALPYFVQGFIEAMFFTESSPAYDSDEWFSDECKEAQEEGTADGNIPGDVGFAELHPDSLLQIIEFCEAYEKAAHDLLEQAYERDGYDSEQAGRDLWFTSQGHGAGFWSRIELEQDDLGDKISNIARYHEANVWFGDHVTYGNAPFVYCEISF